MGPSGSWARGVEVLVAIAIGLLLIALAGPMVERAARATHWSAPVGAARKPSPRPAPDPAELE